MELVAAANLYKVHIEVYVKHSTRYQRSNEWGNTDRRTIRLNYINGNHYNAIIEQHGEHLDDPTHAEINNIQCVMTHQEAEDTYNKLQLAQSKNMKPFTEVWQEMSFSQSTITDTDTSDAVNKNLCSDGFQCLLQTDTKDWIFDAWAHLLYGDSKYFRIIKRACVDHLERNKEIFKYLAKCHNDTTYKKFINKIRCGAKITNWHCIAYCLFELYGIHSNMIDKRGYEVHTTVDKFSGTGQARRPIFQIIVEKALKPKPRDTKITLTHGTNNMFKIWVPKEWIGKNLLTSAPGKIEKSEFKWKRLPNKKSRTKRVGSKKKDTEIKLNRIGESKKG